MFARLLPCNRRVLAGFAPASGSRFIILVRVIRAVIVVVLLEDLVEVRPLVGPLMESAVLVIGRAKL